MTDLEPAPRHIRCQARCHRRQTEHGSAHSLASICSGAASRPEQRESYQHKAEHDCLDASEGGEASQHSPNDGGTSRRGSLLAIQAGESQACRQHGKLKSRLHTADESATSVERRHEQTA